MPPPRGNQRPAMPSPMPEPRPITDKERATALARVYRLILSRAADRRREAAQAGGEDARSQAEPLAKSRDVTAVTL
jgi:hypothetical protein